MDSENIKKTIEKSNVPNNLPHGELNNDYNLNIKIPKQKLKLFLKIIIISIIILLAAPRIINNVSNTASIIGVEVQKFPTIFPSLTMTGTIVGSFIFDEVKLLSNFLSENLATIAQILYQRKLNGSQSEIIKGSIETFEKPVKIIIDKVNINSLILNPKSTKIADLNKALNYGVVRYEKSGLLGENDNVYLFGHSTSIKTVRNKAYKALNGLENLESGDVIKIQSENREYLYKVTSLTMEKDSEAIVRFNTGKRTLTISTCYTLGNKEDRYIIKADFLTSYPLISNTPSNNKVVLNPNKDNNEEASHNIINTETKTQKIFPIKSPIISDPNGRIDLAAEITEIGILDHQTNEFIATSTPRTVDKIAFKFIISNLGTKEVSNWTFNVVLPTNPVYIFYSDTQESIGPGEKIEYALGFDQAKKGKGLIIVNVDPARKIAEITENNNIIKKIIDILK